ncbi:hypothetical protein GS399_11085 [Pedobacter sp. HMF7647]|uniref:YcxB family protein n=1 Tax=Hufsiella arboris TaxID=2695275 RepID=A0A7K1YAA8_9SPHI|nr:hypothetical protein [Hufsiella arboris]MXV51515.1 hypothetical protein [Hufsiella arboris]
MRFQIPFNPERFIELNRLYFKRANEKTRQSGWAYAAWGILLVFLSNFNHSSTIAVNLLFGVGLAFIVIGLHNFYAYWKGKRKFNALVNKISEQHDQQRGSAIWEFREHEFYYEDYQHQLRYEWAGFNKAEIVDGCILYLYRVEGYMPMMLHQNEIGEASFNEVVSFLEKVIPSGIEK